MELRRLSETIKALIPGSSPQAALAAISGGGQVGLNLPSEFVSAAQSLTARWNTVNDSGTRDADTDYWT